MIIVIGYRYPAENEKSWNKKKIIIKINLEKVANKRFEPRRAKL